MLQILGQTFWVGHNFLCVRGFWYKMKLAVPIWHHLKKVCKIISHEILRTVTHTKTLLTLLYHYFILLTLDLIRLFLYIFK